MPSINDGSADSHPRAWFRHQPKNGTTGAQGRSSQNVLAGTSGSSIHSLTLRPEVEPRRQSQVFGNAAGNLGTPNLESPISPPSSTPRTPPREAHSCDQPWSQYPLSSAPLSQHLSLLSGAPWHRNDPGAPFHNALTTVLSDGLRRG